jgi:hypothetical protein
MQQHVPDAFTHLCAARLARQEAWIAAHYEILVQQARLRGFAAALYAFECDENTFS